MNEEARNYRITVEIDVDHERLDALLSEAPDGIGLRVVELVGPAGGQARVFASGTEEGLEHWLLFSYCGAGPGEEEVLRLEVAEILREMRVEE
jgi:hypothetical protein